MMQRCSRSPAQTHPGLGVEMRVRSPSTAAAWIAFSTLLVGCQVPLNFEGASSAEIASRLVAERRIPAISYAVVSNGEVVATGAHGVADLETGEAVGPDTLFEAASLTKQVVATIAMRLFAAGVFDLDESVADSVEAPRITDRATYAKVAPRHLLAHMSGLPNWSGDPLDPERDEPLAFGFQPGDQFSYSGEGYEILQAFLEKKSGRSMEELSRELFDELGMTHSTLTGTSSKGEIARGHWGLTPSRSARRSNQPVAAFSLLTNAQDYARLLQYTVREGSFSPAVLSEFRRRQVTIEQVDTSKGAAAFTLGWSLGWGILERPDATTYFQWGDNGAFRAFAAFSQDSRDGIVYFVNGSDGLVHANDLARPVLGDLSPATEWFTRPYLEWARKCLTI